MKLALAAILLVIATMAAQARPSPYPPPDQFAGDRYAGTRLSPGSTPHVAQTGARTRHHRARYAQRAVHGRPAAWCGWWLGQHLGISNRNLWIARNWASVGSSSGGPQVGAIVVWRHHVGIITGHNAMGWVVKSGNDGHRVRERPRSLAHAIAFRRV